MSIDNSERGLRRTPAATGADSSSTRSLGLKSIARSPWALFVVFVAATMVRGTGPILADADMYWNGALRIAGVIDVAPIRFWGLRGYTTGMLYTPAAALSGAVGGEYATVIVLVQNSLFIAAVGVFLLPAVVRRWTPVPVVARWCAAALAFLAFSSFAPYVLVDIYAVAAVLVTVLLIDSRSLLGMFSAGVGAGVAMNLRPAYIVTMVAIAVIMLVANGSKALIALAGVGVALAPQSLVNMMKFNSTSLIPVETTDLLELQAASASYLVRYDTVLDSVNRKRFFCSPSMAAQLGPDVPDSTASLVGAFFDHMPTSLGFALQKISGALRWQASSPYAVSNPGLDLFVSIWIVSVVVFGIFGLFWGIRRIPKGNRIASRAVRSALGAIGVGGVITLLSSATETRFAIPLVTIGILGCVTLAAIASLSGELPSRLMAVGVLAGVVLTLVVSNWGLATVMPDGVVTAEGCAALLGAVGN